MAQPSSETITLASQLQDSLAGSGLTPSFAKLYSQHTRLRAGRPGLAGWREEEAVSRLNDAMRLVEAAFVKREIRDDSWHDGMRRAGELLEWLSLPELNPNRLPIRLLAAAAYQLAGYPARSSGLLREDTTEGTESGILRSLLKADFPSLFRLLTEHWARAVSSTAQVGTGLPWHDTDALSDRFHQWIVDETASSLGILCAKMRWGTESRLQRALDKLSAVGKVLLHGDDPYSWLLAKLCAEVASVYVESSMRNHLQELSHRVSQTGRTVLDRYLCQSYQDRRALAWPSQVRGIELLTREESFALCTPTGSGKTTIAELAILQSLFLEPTRSSEQINAAPLAVYLVPSKALATEVELKLSRVLRRITNEQVIVSGLYGGTDWGPTDAWLTAEDRTVLICTYEKAEALMRFLGPLFLHRVSLIVIDEAHTVQFNGDRDSLREAESRELRLESLGARLFTYLDQSRSRIIALSAVASEVEGALASWVANQANASPVKTSYRSTRQLIGRLECLPNRRFEIRYDLLDGAGLRFEEGGQSDTPYIPNPFPSYPPAVKWEAETSGKQLRPYLFWAAMHLAAPDDKGQQRAVLISITQQIGGYAEDFLKLLNSTWIEVEKPLFFQEPVEPRKLDVWQKCLRSCSDYFGTRSREYRLLKKGVVVHHGKMPGLMARLLVDVIQERIVHLVMATSTLSEGVNLPFETVLIPILQRWSRNLNRYVDLNAREFSNLVGRAGRPGFGTEGRSLILLDTHSETARRKYSTLIGGLQERQEVNDGSPNARSPLAELLVYLEEQWRRLSGYSARGSFFNWLEQTAPMTVRSDLTDSTELSAVETLDSLDSLLLSAIVEIERIAGKDLSADELEERLQRIWQRSYAHYANREQARLEEFFIRRGRALKTRIYSDLSQRRRLYRTSLPPRSGNQLLTLYPVIREHLSTGGEYAIWLPDERFNYIQTVVNYLGTLSKFRLDDPRGNVSWNEILRWWLDPSRAARTPNKSQISTWHYYVSQNFGYRFNWGLGSIVALAIDEAYGGELLEPSLEEWPQTGLPWIVFWLKELIVWGTLEPVAAYLLAKGFADTRTQAETLAQPYYEYFQDQTPNERLNAATVRNWAQQSFSSPDRFLPGSRPPSQIRISLSRDFSNAPSQRWRVVPVEVGDEIQWFDPAGFRLAICHRPEDWQSDYLNTYDFMLDPDNQVVSSRAYV